jgi:hypothetical protein
VKTTADVIRYIEESTTAMLNRPDGYAANPESLEDQLTLLDFLRLQLLAPETDPDALRHDAGYYAFLRSKGFGVANFCARQRYDSKQAIESRDLFFMLAKFWREYMQSPPYAGPRPR